MAAHASHNGSYRVRGARPAIRTPRRPVPGNVEHGTRGEHVEPFAVKLICDETCSSGGSTSCGGPGDLSACRVRDPARGPYDLNARTGLAEKTSLLRGILGADDTQYVLACSSRLRCRGSRTSRATRPIGVRTTKYMRASRRSRNTMAFFRLRGVSWAVVSPGGWPHASHGLRAIQVGGFSRAGNRRWRAGRCRCA